MAACPTNVLCAILFRFALLDWSNYFLRAPSFAISLFLFELFGTIEFLDRLVRNPTQSYDVVHSTITEFHKIMKSHGWIIMDLRKPDTVLTFKNVINTFIFTFVYMVKVQDLASADEKIQTNSIIKSKSDQLQENAKLIVAILKVLMKVPKRTPKAAN